MDTIYGGSGANTIYGYGGNDTLSGGAGNDTLYGGAATDKLTGGAGNDTFVYANGDGKDTITDYTAGQDTLQISGGSIGKTALANSNKDLVFTVGSGTVTLTGAAAKAISLKDSRGSYTASNTAITLGSDFTGTMDATKYLSTVKDIDGSAAAKAANITGNGQANVIKAGKGGGTINGGAGNDTLYGGAGTDKLTGGAGSDTFVYNGGGTDTVTDYTAGQDTLQISGGSIGKTALANSNKDLVFTAGSGTDEDLRISDFLELDEEAPFWTDDRTSEDKEKPEKDSKESEERKNSGLGDGKTVQVRIYTTQTNRSRIARIYSIVQGGSYLDAMKKLSISPVIVSIQSGKAGEFIRFVKKQGGFAEIV